MTVIIYLLNIDIFFLFVLAFMILPLMFIQMRYGNQRYALSVEMTEANRLNSYFESLLFKRETIKEIRINNLEDHYIKKWIQSFKFNASKHIKLDIKQTKWLIASNLILVFSFIISGGFAYQLTLQGVLTIGVIAGVIQAIQSLQGIVPGFTSNISNLYESSLFVNDYRSFAPMYYEKNKPIEITLPVEKIEITNLYFKYPNQSKNTLNNINLSIKQGDKIAIIGENGSGKTTLIKCLIGLYNTEKMIKINDIHYLEELEKEDYWRSLSILFQDFNRYDLSVKENIGLDNKKIIDMEKIRKVAKAVGIDQYVNNLPLQYDTTLGVLFKNGKELSGGQWQKIAIARAYYKEANFLFLDEPTSALDSGSEYYIVKNLLKKIENRAVVYITHRINVAMLADKIIIMNEGRIAEEGSHEELLKVKGLYYDLYHKQLNYLIKEEGGIPIG